MALWSFSGIAGTKSLTAFFCTRRLLAFAVQCSVEFASESVRIGMTISKEPMKKKTNQTVYGPVILEPTKTKHMFRELVVEYRTAYGRVFFVPVCARSKLLRKVGTSRGSSWSLADLRRLQEFGCEVHILGWTLSEYEKMCNREVGE